MTTEERVRTALDARDRAILAAVWKQTRTGCGVTYRTVAAVADIPLTTVFNHAQRLIEISWLAGDDGYGRIDRFLRPGPRFAGMDHGWPLEVIR